MLAMATGLLAAGAKADDAGLDAMLADRALGAANAPVTIYEYASFTCPHCARFHRDTLPEIKKAYVDTGKVRLIFRDFPFDGLALRAGMLARCAPPERYFAFLDTLFASQDRWARASDPLGALSQIGRVGGLSAQQIEACFSNRALMDGVVKIRYDNEQKLGINSTPTFFVNGVKLEGAASFTEFQAVIEAALKKAS